MIGAFVWAALHSASVGYEAAHDIGLEAKIGGWRVAETRPVTHIAGNIGSYKIENAASAVLIPRYDRLVSGDHHQTDGHWRYVLPGVNLEFFSDRIDYLVVYRKADFVNRCFAGENAVAKIFGHSGVSSVNQTQRIGLEERSEFGFKPDFARHGLPSISKDRRMKEHQSDRRRVVIALRERAGRTLTFIRHREAEGVDIARARMLAGTKLFADEASHWDVLEGEFDATRINHSESYSDGHGKHTNMVESYFSRLRRMVAGQHHHVSHRYLYQYANHAAWLEDHRRRSNGGNAHALLGGALNHSVSRVWAGYWQRAS